MSYILDALRKSEQERQMAAEPYASLLYPAVAENQQSGRVPLVFGAGAGATLLIALVTWWLWPPPAIEKAPEAVAQVQLPVAVPPVAAPPATRPEMELAPAPISDPIVETSARTAALPLNSPSTPVAVPKPMPKMTQAVTKKKESVVEAEKVEAPPTASIASNTASSGKVDADSDPLPKNLPPLAIAGFIRDDQGNSLAMINEKLVGEGEELLPGLRLEKIEGESLILSYKGHRFRR